MRVCSLKMAIFITIEMKGGKEMAKWKELEQKKQAAEVGAKRTRDALAAKTEAEKVEAEKAEAEKVEAEKTEAEKVEVEKAEAEKVKEAKVDEAGEAKDTKAKKFEPDAALDEAIRHLAEAEDKKEEYFLDEAENKSDTSDVSDSDKPDDSEPEAAQETGAERLKAWKEKFSRGVKAISTPVKAKKESEAEAEEPSESEEPTEESTEEPTECKYDCGWCSKALCLEKGVFTIDITVGGVPIKGTIKIG